MGRWRKLKEKTQILSLVLVVVLPLKKVIISKKRTPYGYGFGPQTLHRLPGCMKVQQIKPKTDMGQTQKNRIGVVDVSFPSM